MGSLWCVNVFTVLSVLSRSRETTFLTDGVIVIVSLLCLSGVGIKDRCRLRWPLKELNVLRLDLRQAKWADLRSYEH